MIRKVLSQKRRDFFFSYFGRNDDLSIVVILMESKRTNHEKLEELDDCFYLQRSYLFMKTSNKGYRVLFSFYLNRLLYSMQGGDAPCSCLTLLF